MNSADRYLIFLFLMYFVCELSVFPQSSADTSGTDTVISIDAINVEAYQVSRQLRTIPGSLSVLSADAINMSDATTLSQALNSLPGVNVQSGTYTTNRIIIRGMGSRTPYNTNRIRTYLNDIPLTTSDGLSSPEEIETQGLGRIELIKGPSSALYGSGLGGSINLYTPSVAENMGKLTAQYGSFNTWKTTISQSFRKGKATLWSNISHLHSDGYRENSRYKRTSMLLTSSWDRQHWKADFLFLITGVNGGIPSSLGKTTFEQDPQAAASNWKAIEGYKKYTRAIAGLSITHRFSDRLSNKLILLGRGIDSYERRPFNNLDDHAISFGFRDKLTLRRDKTDWVLGAEWIQEDYAWQLDTSRVLLNRNRESRKQTNIFAMLYFRPVPDLNISIAGAVNVIRYRLIDRFIANGIRDDRRNFPLIFSPRIGINYSPNPSWALYASAGHGFSMPSPEETLLPEGDVNPDIRHEQGLQFEIGGRLNMLNNRIGLDATLYWIELQDLLVTKRITEDIFTGINAGKTRHQGLELMVHSIISDYHHFPGRLTGNFAYTQTINQFIEFTDEGNIYDGKVLPGIPDNMVYLQLTWNPVENISMDADIRYTGHQYLDDGNLLDYEGFGLSNIKLSAEFRVRKKDIINLYGGINNIGNTSYASMLIVNATGFGGSEPRYFYPGMPRHGYIGVQYTF